MDRPGGVGTRASSGVGKGARALGRGALGLAGVALLALVLVAPLEPPTQLALGAVVFAHSVFLARVAGPRVTRVLVLLSLVTTARYLAWRLTTTVAADGAVGVLLCGVLLAAELHLFLLQLLGPLQREPERRRPAPLPADAFHWPTVDVLIPTGDSALEEVRATVLAARAMVWPADKLRVHLLDDSRRPALRAFAAEADVGCLVRADDRHGRAETLDHALAHTGSEYVLVLDCGCIPARSFLQRTLGGFLRDSRLALAQTPRPFDAPARAAGGGTCAVLRRKALEEVGGFAVGTVTQDAHTALRLQRRGWRTASLDGAQVGALVSESLSAHVGQRIRWARGLAQLFRVDSPLLGRGLPLRQRLCALTSLLRALGGLPRLVLLLAPVAFLLAGRPLLEALPVVALAYGLPHVAQLALTTARARGGLRQALWSEVSETCLALCALGPALAALLHPGARRSEGTDGAGRSEALVLERRIARPALLLLVANLAGAGVGVWRLWTGPGALEGVLLPLFWTGCNGALLCAALALAWEQRQARESARVGVHLPAMLRTAEGRTVRCHTVDLSHGGAQLSLGSERPFTPGQRLSLSLFAGSAEHPLPVAVVDQAGTCVRVRFDALSLQEETALVEALVSRAGRWTALQQRPRPVTVLQALGLLLKHAAQGATLFGRARPRGAVGASSVGPEGSV